MFFGLGGAVGVAIHSAMVVNSKQREAGNTSVATHIIWRQRRPACTYSTEQDQENTATDERDDGAGTCVSLIACCKMNEPRCLGRRTRTHTHIQAIPGRPALMKTN